MSKRPRRGKLAETSEKSQSSSKKPRIDVGNAEEILELATPELTPPPATPRDAEYYYEDGSVILLVDNVLFKVHASLLKAQSQVFRDMLALPLDGSHETPAGTTDERPLDIPEVTATAFRNLLKIVYFQFGMADIEEWAEEQLESFAETSATRIATGAKDQMKDRIPQVFISTLWHAMAMEDPSRGHDVRNLIQYYCTLSPNLSPSALFEHFRNPQLLEKDPSLFGFLFVTLLNLGHNVWEHKPFTREDRIIFFSAQSYLTPLPKSLGKGFTMPLLKKPLYESGRLQEFEDKVCPEGCHRRLTTAWKGVFNAKYYDNVSSNEAMRATAQLGQLPCLRLEYAKVVRAHPSCDSDCSLETLEWLDADIFKLFKRLADYHRPVN
ncbi:hypothetical protein FRC07_006871 [Ceratobasidium sp. 392]|nr:hypothetical protein FRC07_006871 [Ceratobasidium sp. 392]